MSIVAAILMICGSVVSYALFRTRSSSDTILEIEPIVIDQPMTKSYYANFNAEMIGNTALANDIAFTTSNELSTPVYVRTSFMVESSDVDLLGSTLYQDTYIPETNRSYNFRQYKDWWYLFNGNTPAKLTASNSNEIFTFMKKANFNAPDFIDASFFDEGYCTLTFYLEAIDASKNPSATTTQQIEAISATPQTPQTHTVKVHNTNGDVIKTFNNVAHGASIYDQMPAVGQLGILESHNFLGYNTEKYCRGASFGEAKLKNIISDVNLYPYSEIKTYTITVEQGENGIITPETKTIEYGSNHTFFMSANEGYNVSDVLVDGTSVGGVSSYVFENIQNNHTITAIFDPLSLSVSVTKTGAGTVSPLHQLVEFGNDATISITPDKGCYISELIVDGTNIGSYDVDEAIEHTITDIKKNIEVVVVFTNSTFNITVTQISNCAITPTVTGIARGSSVTITATPNENYRLKHLLVDGEVVPATVAHGQPQSYVFANIDRDHTFSAMVERNAYNVNVTIADTNMGTATPLSAVVDSGKNQTITLQPKEGYHLLSILDNGVKMPTTNDQLTYVVENVTTNRDIVITYEIMKREIFVTSTANGSVSQNSLGNTSIQGPATQKSLVKVEYNTTVSVDVTPDAGYAVSSIKLTNKDTNVVSNITIGELSLNKKTIEFKSGSTYTMKNNWHIEVSFVQFVFNLNVIVKTEAVEGDAISVGGTITGGGDLNYNDPINLIVTPNDGFAFNGYYSDENLQNPYSVPTVMPSENLTVYAYFTRLSFILKIEEIYQHTSNNTYLLGTDGGTAQADKTFKFGETLTFEAPKAKVGFTFVNYYQDPSGKTANNITKMPASALTLYAKFDRLTSILKIDPKGGSYKGSTAVQSITQRYGSTYTLETPTLKGHTFPGWKVTYDTTNEDASSQLSGQVFTFNEKNVNAELNGEWQPITYTLSINMDGGGYGGAYYNVEVYGHYNETVTLLGVQTSADQDPSQYITPPAGYKFVEYKKESGSAGTLVNDNGVYKYTFQDTNGAIKAVWDTEKYTLSIHNYYETVSGSFVQGNTGGTVLGGDELTVNSAINLTPQPNQGFEFKTGDYYTDATLTTKATVPALITEDLILYAKFSRLSYAFHIVVECEEPEGEFTQVAPTESGSNFVVETLGGTVTWKKGTMSGDKYYFKYETTGLFQQPTVNTGFSVKIYPSQQKVPSSAKTYSTALATMGTADITYYITYYRNEYNLTIKPNGGVYDGKTSQIVVSQKLGTTYDVLQPTRTGYQFVEWKTSNNVVPAEMQFRGVASDSINLGRQYMYTDKLSYNLWAYMSNWSSFTTGNMRLISCTEGGGFNIEPNNTSTGYIQFATYDKTGNTYRLATADIRFGDLSSGWHMFSYSFDGKNAKGYIDGKLVKTSPDFSGNQIGYNGSNVLWLGCEATGSTSYGGSYFNGYMQAFQIENAAYTAEHVKALYEEGRGATTYTFITQNVTWEAQWKVNEYTLTVDPNGGTYDGQTGIQTITGIAHNTAYNLLNPVWTGRTFDGWDVSSGNCEITAKSDGTYSIKLLGDVSITAKSKLNEYTITVHTQYQKPDGTYVEGDKGGTYTIEGEVPYLYNSTAKIIPEPLTGAGFKLGGFYSNGTTSTKLTEDTTLTLTMTEDKVVYIRFDLNNYTLTIDPNGGKYNNATTTTTISGKPGKTIDLSLPTRAEHGFLGWTQTNNNGVLNGQLKYTFGVGNETLTAQWEKASYNIVVYPYYQKENNGTITAVAGEIGGTAGAKGPNDFGFSTFAMAKTDQKVLLKATAEDGYEFGGWYTSSTFSTDSKIADTAEAEYTITAAINLYPLFKLKTYSVKLMDGDTVVSTISVYRTTVLANVVNDIRTKTGKNFVGYNTNATKPSIGRYYGNILNPTFATGYVNLDYGTCFSESNELTTTGALSDPMAILPNLTYYIANDSSRAITVLIYDQYGVFKASNTIAASTTKATITETEPCLVRLFLSGQAAGSYSTIKVAQNIDATYYSVFGTSDVGNLAATFTTKQQIVTVNIHSTDEKAMTSINKNVGYSFSSSTLIQGEQVKDHGSNISLTITPTKDTDNRFFIRKIEIVASGNFGETSQEDISKTISEGSSAYNWNCDSLSAGFVINIYVSSVVILNINDGAGVQPNVSYSGDTFTINDPGQSSLPTSGSKQFYYYSTGPNSNDGATSVNGVRGLDGIRYDLSLSTAAHYYPLNTSEGILTLYATYLSPVMSADKTATVVSNGTTSITGSYRSGSILIWKNGYFNAFDEKYTGLFYSADPLYLTLPRYCTTIGEFALGGCKDLLGVCFPSFGFTTIGRYAFEKTFDLNYSLFNLPKTLTSIGESAWDESGITALDIGGTLTWGNFTNAFKGASYLHTLNGSDNFASIDGVLYNSSKNTMYVCPPGKSTQNFVVPTSVYTISTDAFNTCLNVKGLSRMQNTGPTITFKEGCFAGSGIRTLTLQGGYAGGLVFETGCFKNMFYLRVAHIDLISSASSFPSKMFASSTSLKELYVTCNSSISFATDAFSGCSSLGYIELDLGSSGLSTSFASSNINSFQWRYSQNGGSTWQNIASIKSNGIYSSDSPEFLEWIIEGVTYIDSNSDGTPDSVTNPTSNSNATIVGYRGSQTVVIVPKVLVYQGATYTIKTVKYLDSSGAGTGISSLKEIEFENGITTIGDGSKSIMGATESSPNETLTMVSFSSSVTTIRKNAFIYNSSLNSIEIAGTVSIGEYAFAYNTSITSLNIKNSSLSSYAFRGCSQLTSIVFGSGSIGSNAFENCINLTSLKLEGIPSSCGASAFSGTTNSLSVYINSSDNYSSYKNVLDGKGFAKDATMVTMEDYLLARYRAGAWRKLYYINIPYVMKASGGLLGGITTYTTVGIVEYVSGGENSVFKKYGYVELYNMEGNGIVGAWVEEGGSITLRTRKTGDGLYLVDANYYKNVSTGAETKITFGALTDTYSNNFTISNINSKYEVYFDLALRTKLFWVNYEKNWRM